MKTFKNILIEKLISLAEIKTNENIKRLLNSMTLNQLTFLCEKYSIN